MEYLLKSEMTMATLDLINIKSDHNFFELTVTISGTVFFEEKASSVLVPHKTCDSGDRNILLDEHVLESSVLGITLGKRRYDPCSLA